MKRAQWTDSETGFLVEVIKKHKEKVGYSAVMSPETWELFAGTINNVWGSGRTGASCSSRMGRVNAKKKAALATPGVATVHVVPERKDSDEIEPPRGPLDFVVVGTLPDVTPQTNIALKALCNGVKRLAGELGCEPDDLLLAMIDEVAK